jgi:hypothetical protein
LSRDFEHPEQEDIDEIIRLLKEIRDLLTGSYMKTLKD